MRAAGSGNPPKAPHPAALGRESESEALADAVRRLISLCVTTTAPPEVTAAALRDLNSAAELLESYVGGAPTSERAPEASNGQTDVAAHLPFDVVIGRHNALALPLDLSFEPPKALLQGAFTRPYEGPPGCVHGAVLAASFDLVLAMANVVAGVPGPTAKLEITYRRPTALFEPCRFEGWVVGQEDRRVHTVGRLLQRDRVTVEAVGEFALFGPGDMARMAARLREE
jgi:hypothetical protein